MYIKIMVLISCLFLCNCGTSPVFDDEARITSKRISSFAPDLCYYTLSNDAANGWNKGSFMGSCSIGDIGDKVSLRIREN